MSILTEEMGRLLAPFKRRLANLIAKAIIESVTDTKNMQLVKVSLGKDELREGLEHPQPYGFTARARTGAEAVVLFPSGNREQGIAILVEDSRCRPKGLVEGAVMMYDYEGNYVRLGGDAGIEFNIEPGRDLVIKCKNCTIDLEAGGKFSVAGTNLTVDK